MSKRELLIPLAAAGLAIAFVVTCVLVVLTRNNSTWVRRKLRVGALLLALTPACGDIFEDDDTVMCYVGVMPNDLSVEGTPPESHPIVVNIPAALNLNAKVTSRAGERFSYRLTGPDDVELYRGNLGAADGAFDESTEEFLIPLASNLAAGRHRLELFTVPADKQPSETTWRHWQLDLREGG